MVSVWAHMEASCTAVLLELPDNSGGEQVMMAVEPSPVAQLLQDDDDKMEDNDDIVYYNTMLYDM